MCREGEVVARRSRMSILKRQRELKKAEKAARKRATRHGQPLPGITEPRPTVLSSEHSETPSESDDEPEEREEQDAEDVTETTT